LLDLPHLKGARMAKRQDSGSDPMPENQRPTSQNEDALPELNDDVRGRADDEDEEFEDSESEEVDEVEEDEGSY
jgi:hypothetical protein